MINSYAVQGQTPLTLQLRRHKTYEARSEAHADAIAKGLYNVPISKRRNTKSGRI